MSAFDKPPSFYQHQDITDPTPYENDDESEDDFVCPICGRPIRRGEKAICMDHRNLAEPVAAHYDCMDGRAESYRMSVGEFCDFLEDLGFEIEEGET